MQSRASIGGAHGEEIVRLVNCVQNNTPPSLQRTMLILEVKLLLDFFVKVTLVLEVVLDVEPHLKPRCGGSGYWHNSVGRYLTTMDSSFPGRTEMVLEGQKQCINTEGVASVASFLQENRKGKFL